MIERNRLDAHVTKRASDETAAIVVFLQVDIRDGRKLCFERGFGGDVFECVGTSLGVAGRARYGGRLNESARAVAPVTVINAHGIAWKSEFRGADRFLDAVPYTSLTKSLRTVRAHLGAPSGRADAAGHAGQC